MADYTSRIMLGAHGPKLTVTLRDHLLPHQTEPALYHVSYNPEERTLALTHVASVKTEYAAVNGIQNDLDRAAVVMLDKVIATADLRRDALPREFTLLHVPQHAFARDLELAGAEKTGFTTPDAKKLSQVLQGVSDSGRKVIWSVHSRGAEVFNAAVRYLGQQGIRLKNQAVAVYSGSANDVAMSRNLSKTGVHLVGTGFFNHPFDPVPQVVGSNTINPFKYYGSLLSSPALFTDQSQHTWHPALSADDYRSLSSAEWEQPGVDLRPVENRVLPKPSVWLDTDPVVAAQVAHAVIDGMLFPFMGSSVHPELPAAVASASLQPALAAVALGAVAPARVFPASAPSAHRGLRM
jgi:hypothetical protein